MIEFRSVLDLELPRVFRVRRNLALRFGIPQQVLPQKHVPAHAVLVLGPVELIQNNSLVVILLLLLSIADAQFQSLDFADLARVVDGLAGRNFEQLMDLLLLCLG